VEYLKEKKYLRRPKFTGRFKTKRFFDEFNSKLNIYESKRKRCMVNGEEIGDANDVYNENPMAEEGKAKMKTIGKRLRKKRVKLGEKLKERKLLQRKELRKGKEINMSNNEITFKGKRTNQKKNYPREVSRSLQADYMN
jgi:hypothetical protein